MDKFPNSLDVGSHVIVTGASSFVGAHLASSFAAAGAVVTATISKPRSDYKGIRADRLNFVARHAKIRVVDIARADDLEHLFDEVHPRLFVHHAAYATGYALPDYDLDIALRTNVLALENIYARLQGRACGVIITGSSAEYAASNSANHEADACWPDTPYGLAKLGETLRARQLAMAFDVPTRVARLYIPFGPLDHPDKLLSQTMAKLGRGESIALSPCQQARDFLGITDVCKAWLRLASDLPRTTFDVFNICSGTAVELQDLLRAIAGIVGASETLLKFGAIPMRPGDAPTSFGSNAKAKDVLGWAPTPLTTALRRDLFLEVA